MVKPQATPPKMTVMELMGYMRRIVPDGLSEQTIRNHMARAGLTTDSQHRVDTVKFLLAYKGAQERDNKNAGRGDDDDPKTVNWRLKNKKLAMEIQVLQGQLMTRVEGDANMREFASFVRDTYKQWVGNATVRPDHAKEDAERLRDRMEAGIRERCGEVKE